MGRLVKNAGKLQSNRAISSLVSAAQIAVVARFLSMTEYGIYGLVLNALSVIQSVFDVRSGELIMRFFFEYHGAGEKRKAGAVLLLGGIFEIAVGLAATALLIALSPWLAATLLRDEGKASLFQLAAVLPLANIGSGLAASILSIDRAYGRVAVADTASTIGGFCVLLSILPFISAVEVLLGVAVLTQFSKAVLRWVFLMRSPSDTKQLFLATVRDPSSLRLLREDARMLLKFGVSNNLLAILKVLQGCLPSFAIGLLRSPADVAAFYLGQRIGSRLSTFVMPIADVSFREAAQERTKGAAGRHMRSIRHGFAIIAAICVPVFVGLVLCGPWSIPFLFGAQYAPEVPAVQATVLAFIIACLINPLQTMLLVQGRTLWINLGFVAGLAIQMGLIYWLVPTEGALGAGLALAVFYLFIGAIMAFAVRHGKGS